LQFTIECGQPASPNVTADGVQPAVIQCGQTAVLKVTGDGV
jgi:hypothetical protein